MFLIKIKWITRRGRCGKTPSQCKGDARRAEVDGVVNLYPYGASVKFVGYRREHIHPFQFGMHKCIPYIFKIIHYKALPVPPLSAVPSERWGKDRVFGVPRRFFLFQYQGNLKRCWKGFCGAVQSRLLPA